jgi:hypothetical protein
MARFVFGVPLILFLASVAFTQNQPQSNPQAVSFASRSIAALTGGQAIRDVTLTGSVTWSGGAAPEMIWLPFASVAVAAGPRSGPELWRRTRWLPRVGFHR